MCVSSGAARHERRPVFSRGAAGGRDRTAGVTGTPGPAEEFTPAAVARRVGWSGPGRAAVMALAGGPGVVAARAGPDRVGARARRRSEEVRHDRPTTPDTPFRPDVRFLKY
ncbi:MAG: hypothetical protein JO034_03750 [Singulisphaera sp.]|nr:hypothetical protein [Singulisphaera sp.]